jgi:hypothetical protein
MGMYDEYWLRRRGATDFQHVKRQRCNDVRNKRLMRYKLSLGRHRNASVVDIRR